MDEMKVKIYDSVIEKIKKSLPHHEDEIFEKEAFIEGFVNGAITIFLSKQR